MTMNKFLCCIISWLIATPTYCMTLSSQVSVVTDIPVTCSISGLPNSITLTLSSKQQTTYATNFYIRCNDDTPVTIFISSQNQNANGYYITDDTSMGNVKYWIFINQIIYNVNSVQTLQPNTNNSLKFIFDKANKVGNYKDTITITVNY